MSALGRPSGPYRREAVNAVNACHQSVLVAIDQSLYGRNWNKGQAHGPSQFTAASQGDCCKTVCLAFKHSARFHKQCIEMLSIRTAVELRSVCVRACEACKPLEASAQAAGGLTR